MVVVTDPETVFDLYEAATDRGRFSVGMARWLALHLGDPNPDVPQFLEWMLLASSLTGAWPVFAAGLEPGKLAR